MRYSMRSSIGEIAASEKGMFLLKKYADYDRMMQDFAQNRLKILGTISKQPVFGLDKAKIEALLEEMNRPVEEVLPEVMTRQSLDERDRISFEAKCTPFDGTVETVTLDDSLRSLYTLSQSLSLDGEWELVSEGSDAQRLSGTWEDGISAAVPGSIHSALVRAGRIPDPTFGCNQKIAREESFKTWWYKKQFTWDTPGKCARLHFDGICNVCYIYLNGTLLGRHEGMFGGPDYDVTALLQAENTLIVKLEPIPFRCWDQAGESSTPDTSANPGNNGSWRDTVVFNNGYGWHYSNLQSLGIWRGVSIRTVPDVEMPHPFLATTDAGTATVRLALTLKAKAGNSGRLQATFTPDNFEGKTYGFEREVKLQAGENRLVYEFRLPEAKLWWPNDLGEQNLYRADVAFLPETGTGDSNSILFGVRTVKMAALPEGPNPYKYNWTFVINGKASFVKGTGWCTLDPLMDFARGRYDHFLSLAHDQHNQLLRAWGSGMPETDDFYELCARYGIMVIQEWPTAWDSHLTQPFNVMEETIRRNMLRLRNAPALVMWGGGNESPNPFGAEIDLMGRLSIELDGTRPFHRGEGWGGSTHDYTCYWGQESLQYNMTLTSEFFGEFGLASAPCPESMKRYLPEEEWNCPPPKNGPNFTYHTPIFGMGGDIARLSQYARYFLPDTYSMEQFVLASQIAQATDVRHPLERARTLWPQSSGALYYKMNDNFPACSWACVDWYGAPKLSYYIFQDTFAPLQAIVLTNKLNMRGTPSNFDVCLQDDASALKDADWEVRIRAYGKALVPIKEAQFSGHGCVDAPYYLGSMHLDYLETDTAPLFVTSETWKDVKLAACTFYWYNFENEKGCMFNLPKTRLECHAAGHEVVVKNCGPVAAVGVTLERPGFLDRFRAEDNVFWLDPGQSRAIRVNQAQGVKVTAWNSEASDNPEQINESM